MPPWRLDQYILSLKTGPRIKMIFDKSMILDLQRILTIVYLKKKKMNISRVSQPASVLAWDSQ